MRVVKQKIVQFLLLPIISKMFHQEPTIALINCIIYTSLYVTNDHK